MKYMNILIAGLAPSWEQPLVVMMIKLRNFPKSLLMI